jgi:hypothetical protein
MSQVLSYELPKHLKARRAAERSERVVQVVALIMALGCFLLAGLFTGPMNKMRKEYQLVIDPSTVKGLPPDISLLGRLGTFRALAIDLASIRADRLKQQGKMYEALDLHKIICRLQPRFASVWVNAAWNMAYNISVTQFTPEARWQWVSNGIKLLRDEGLQYNPRSITIYKELVWIYWHKMGDFLDDEHRAYRKCLAVEMEQVLGAMPVALTAEEYYAWFKEMVDAPRDLDRMIEEDPEVKLFVERLEAAGVTLDETLLELAARHLRPRLTMYDFRKGGLEESPAVRVLKDKESAAVRDRLLAAVRSEVLRKKLKLDLDFMYGLMVQKKYGPIDWRSPFAHALYWAERGNEMQKGRVAGSAVDAMNTARLVKDSLQALVTRGRITVDPNFDDPLNSYFEESPDTRFILPLFETYQRLALEQWPEASGIEETPFFRGFVSYVHNWIELLCYEGGERNRALAQEFYVYLREKNKNPDGTTQEMYLKTLDEFIQETLIDQLKTYKQAPAIIRSFIRRSLKHLSLGQDDQALDNVRWARKAYKFWTIDTLGDPNERRRMQDFHIIYRDEVVNYMKTEIISPLAKSWLWKELGTTVSTWPLWAEDLGLTQARQMTYDQLSPYFARLCESLDPPWDVNKAFPPPPGMEEFREQQIRYRDQAREEEGISTGTRYKD